MPLGVIDSVFASSLMSLRDEAAAQARAGAGVTAELTYNALRPWQLGDLTLWDGNPLDIVDIANAYQRDDIGVVYLTVIHSAEGTTGDAASLKYQSDYLGQQERAFRARHASPIRRSLHALAIRAGHGRARGVFGRVNLAAAGLLIAGSIPMEE